VVKALITVESFDPSTPLRERCSKRLGDCYNCTYSGFMNEVRYRKQLAIHFSEKETSMP
jgi:hypothetical protein